jgi:hypothetical protein
MMDMLSKGMAANINKFPLWRFEPTEEQVAKYQERKPALMGGAKIAHPKPTPLKPLYDGFKKSNSVPPVGTPVPRIPKRRARKKDKVRFHDTLYFFRRLLYVQVVRQMSAFPSCIHQLISTRSCHHLPKYLH